MPDSAAPDAATLADNAARLLRRLDQRDARVAVAESCTGGLLASLLTDIEGLSHAFDRGFVTYHDAAKAQMLGVAPAILARDGAVSEAAARAMVTGALAHSAADLALAVTGYAGPPGDDEAGEEGLVYVAAALREGEALVACHRWGTIGRDAVRANAAAAAFVLGDQLLDGDG